jgi:hypothetical protein
VLLAGCTSSSGFQNVYLLSLSYQNNSAESTNDLQANPNISTQFTSIVGNASLEVRTGYMGMCLLMIGDSWVCSNSARTLANIVKVNKADDPLNLIWISSKFQESIIFDGLL